MEALIYSRCLTSATVRIIEITVGFFVSQLSLLTFDKYREGSKIAKVSNEKRFLLIVMVAVFIAGIVIRVMAQASPIRYDETYTFRNYVLSGIRHAVSTYNLPNNHVFHSLLGNIAAKIFSYDLSSVRLVAFSFGCSLLALAAFITWRVAGILAALFSLAFMSSSFYLIDFSSNARGYIIQCFLVLLSVFLIYLIREKSNPKLSALIGLVFALTLYTVPSILAILLPMGIFYALFSLRSWLKSKETGGLKNTATIGLTTAAMTFLFYSPIIYKEGIKALSSVDRVDWQAIASKVPSHFFTDFFEYISTGQGPVISFTVLLSAGFALYCLWKSNRYLFAVFFTMIIGPPIASFILKVVPPSRTLLPLVPIYLCLSGIGLGKIFDYSHRFFPKVSTYFAAILAALIPAKGIASYYNNLESAVTRENQAGVTAFVEFLTEYAKDGDVVASAGNPIERISYHIKVKGNKVSGLQSSWGLTFIEIQKPSASSPDTNRDRTVFFFETPRSAPAEANKLMKKKFKLEHKADELRTHNQLKIPTQKYASSSSKKAK